MSREGGDTGGGKEVTEHPRGIAKKRQRRRSSSDRKRRYRCKSEMGDVGGCCEGGGSDAKKRDKSLFVVGPM